MITLGSRVGDYTVLQELGHGGMGWVYLAQHRRIDRRAAVKVLRPELSADVAVVERFFAEARAISSMGHPGIVKVLGCDVADDIAFIVMELLEGESLAGYLRRLPGMTSDRSFALAVVGQVARAVAASHARGIIHRDLRAENVFLCATATESRIVTKVLDFGIAELATQRDAMRMRSGAMIGTPAYMSPEQCRHGNRILDARSDVYSLGCILYETLCGSPPFVRGALGGVILAHVSEAPEPLLARVPDLPPILDALTMRMLAKDPNARPQSMEEVWAQIIAYLETFGPQVPISDIRPIEPVIVRVRGRSATPSVGIPPTPLPPAPKPAAAVSGSPVPNAGTQIRFRATRSPPTGGSAPIPATFREKAGESMRRAFTSPRAHSGALLAVAAVVVVATVMSQRTPHAIRPVDDSASTISRPAGEARALAKSGASSVPERVAIDVRVFPPGAQIWLDGALTAALPLRLLRDDRPHVLSLRASGYEERTITIDAQRDLVVDVVMSLVPSATKTGIEPPKVAGARQSPRARDRTAGALQKVPYRSSEGTSGRKRDGKRNARRVESHNLDAITGI